MPVVVVATFAVKPESVEAVREICTKAVAQVHEEPGCQLYSLHEADGSFVFIEQWADADALKAHSTAPQWARCSAASPSTWRERPTSRCCSRFRPGSLLRASCGRDRRPLSEVGHGRAALIVGAARAWRPATMAAQTSSTVGTIIG